MGVTWNNKDGIDPKEALKQVQSGSAGRTQSTVSAGGPPPPPPPPMPTFDSPTGPPSSVAKSPGSGDMGAIFDQLNQGSSVTSGLRKVDRSEMTHKNPSLRAGAVVPTRSDSASSTTSRGKSPAPPGKKPKPESMRTKKPPRKELDGNKWIIENYENESTPIEIEASINHSILISRCSKTTIRIKGKANAISVDNSTRLALVIDSLVSSVDVIKAPNFALQVLGTLPTILLDQVDGASIYLSKTSLETEIFSSKCSGINLNLPGAREDDDFREEPLPEQIRSYIKGGKVLNEIVEHAG
jgi:adenylyl cyclase-associated protein